MYPAGGHHLYADFAAVQKALKKNPRYIYNPKVKAKLQSVLAAMPNHVSKRRRRLRASVFSLEVAVCTSIVSNVDAFVDLAH